MASMVSLPVQEDPVDVLAETLRQLSADVGLKVPGNSEDIQRQLDGWSSSRSGVIRPAPGNGLRLPHTTRGRRRCEYTRFQQAWKRNRGREARRTVTSLSWLGEESAMPDETLDFWKALFKTSSPPPAPGDFLSIRDSMKSELRKPISEEKVEAALQTIKLVQPRPRRSEKDRRRGPGVLTGSDGFLTPFCGWAYLLIAG